MKTAIAIDSLLLRDESIFLVELILNLFTDSEIYTIVHKQGGILGTIETKSIVSSFLTHKAKKNPDVLQKNFWAIPSAVKGIPIHPSIEKVIVISRGYIHGLNLPPNIEKYLYILDWDIVDQSKLGWQKVFTPYVNNWREKALTQYPKIAVSSKALQKRLELPNADVIEPTYRTEEYPFVRDEDHNFMFTHHLVYTHGLKKDDFVSLIKTLTKHDEMVRVLGPDAHLSDVKTAFPQVEFGGDHCEATNALYSHQAKAIWDFSESFFPSKSLGAFSTGRPVIVREGELQREFLPQHSHFVKGFDSEELERVYKEVDGSYLSVDRKVLRRAGLRWNERLFKARLNKFAGKNL